MADEVVAANVAKEAAVMTNVASSANTADEADDTDEKIGTGAANNAILVKEAIVANVGNEDIVTNKFIVVDLATNEANEADAASVAVKANVADKANEVDEANKADKAYELDELDEADKPIVAIKLSWKC